MLCSLADNLFWLGRYLKRADHMIRLFEVNLEIMTNSNYHLTEYRWWLMLTSLGIVPQPNKSSTREDEIFKLYLFDEKNYQSALYCIAQARMNARQLRSIISSEIFERINELFLAVKSATPQEDQDSRWHDFFKKTKSQLNLIQGSTQEVMLRDDGWAFLQLGKYLEHLGSVASLLNVFFSDYQDQVGSQVKPSDYIEWVGLLKSVSAFESYLKVHTNNLKPELIVDLLVFSQVFPQSIRYSVDKIFSALKKIKECSKQPMQDQEIHEALHGLEVVSKSGGEEFIHSNRGVYFNEIQRKCIHLNNLIYKTYIEFPNSYFVN